MKMITLKYSNALNSEKHDFAGEFEDIFQAVESLVKTFPAEFNPANVDFEQVVVDDNDLGIEGLIEAELALQKFYH